MNKLFVIVGLLVFYSYSQALENWPRFRGNNGDGYADCNIPHSWIDSSYRWSYDWHDPADCPQLSPVDAARHPPADRIRYPSGLDHRRSLERLLQWRQQRHLRCRQRRAPGRRPLASCPSTAVSV